MRQRVRDEIVQRIDMDAWNLAVEIEKTQVESMQHFHAQWTKHISRQARK